MGMDRNTVIGFVLLAVLFIGYFYYTRQGQLTLEKDRQHQQDSINKLRPQVDTSINLVANPESVSPKPNSLSSGIIQDSSAKEEFITVENKVLKITFSNRGGQPQKVELKNFKTFDKRPLILQDGHFNNISFYKLSPSLNLRF